MATPRLRNTGVIYHSYIGTRRRLCREGRVLMLSPIILYYEICGHVSSFFSDNRRSTCKWNCAFLSGISQLTKPFRRGQVYSNKEIDVLVVLFGQFVYNIFSSYNGLILWNSAICGPLACQKLPLFPGATW